MSCTADVPNLENDGGISQQCTPHADLLVTYTPPGATGSSVEGENTLGAPDAETIALSAGGVLTVAFVGLGGIRDLAGPDILVHAAGVDGTSVSAFASTTDDGEFTYVGELSGSQTEPYEIDLATGSVSVAVYLRLVGIAETLTIDAFESGSNQCSALFAR